jgi:fructuronate reductase
VLDLLPSAVGRFAYDRAAQSVGIVHLGIGAFHRAHQAIFTDLAMSAGDRDWAICGVSLRSRTVRDQLVPQGSLYSLTQRGPARSTSSIVGSVRSVLAAADDPGGVVAALADPASRIVTLTVTEKGYYGEVGGGLNLASSDIAHDLSSAPDKRTIYGFLAAGLARRRASGLAGLTLVSCDNLAENGARLAASLAQFLDRADPSLGKWFQAECATPSTMVDRIVPATTAKQIDLLETQLGCRDEAAVFTEPFSQWVIEDKFAGPRPRWEVAGAQFVSDVRPYEVAKLRMLNGAHSALAYVGLRRGHTYVHEAIADPHLGQLVIRLMLEEAAPTLPPADGLDPSAYATALLERFGNSALGHRLEQIAMDGSQKIPQRWLPVLRFHQAEGRQCPAILEALAAWILHVRSGPDHVADPLAGRLAQIWLKAGCREVARALFGAGGLFADDWTATPDDLQVLRSRLDETG